MSRSTSIISLCLGSSALWHTVCFKTTKHYYRAGKRSKHYDNGYRAEIYRAKIYRAEIYRAEIYRAEIYRAEIYRAEI